MATGAELNYNRGASATQMAETIFGDDVQIVGATYTGARNSSAIYSGGDTISPDATPSDTGLILSTGDVRDFTQSSGDPNRSASTSSDMNPFGTGGDADFNALAGTQTYDAAILEVDFIPTTNYLSMQFVFASEEYPEYVSSIFNDIVGVWSNGVYVPLSVGNASIGGINQTNTSNLYIDNTGDAYNTEMDGFTVTMTLEIPVIPGQVNTLKIGIADVADASYDSNLLIAANSVQGAVLVNDDDFTIAPNQTKTFDVLANDVNQSGGSLTITHINGIAVTAGSTVTLSTGQVLTLNADGTITVVNDADIEDFSFTYTGTGTTGGSGNTQSDTGIVTITSIPCFVAGTLIRTPDGDRPVESLKPGDLVMTYDDGPQPLRWIGRRVVPAEGKLAPIKIRRGTFGKHGTLLVSPQHRILVRDVLAELLFAERDVLVKARDLVNGGSVKIMEGGEVEYIHLLFDTHQVIFSEGLATESFLPGPQTTSLFEKEIVEEIVSIFPELDPMTGAGYGPSARLTLKEYEARTLLAVAA